MSGPRFERVHDRIWRLSAPFRETATVNLYLVRGEKTALFDSGVLGTPTTLVAPALDALGLTLGDVDILINTHGHVDHLGGNAEMKEAGADIAIHLAPQGRTRRFHRPLSAEQHSSKSLVLRVDFGESRSTYRVKARTGRSKRPEALAQNQRECVGCASW